MGKIRCEICGKPGSRINFICGECTAKIMAKANVKIGKNTLEAIEELDAALEIMAQAGADPEEESELLRKIRR